MPCDSHFYLWMIWDCSRLTLRPVYDLDIILILAIYALHRRIADFSVPRMVLVKMHERRILDSADHRHLTPRTAEENSDQHPVFQPTHADTLSSGSQ